MAVIHVTKQENVYTMMILRNYHKKYAITVTTGENYGSKDTSKVLNRLMSYSGARIRKK